MNFLFSSHPAIMKETNCCNSWPLSNHIDYEGVIMANGNRSKNKVSSIVLFLDDNKKRVLSKKEFDDCVLRHKHDKVPAKYIKIRKADATPLQWAGRLIHEAENRAKPENNAKAAVRAKKFYERNKESVDAYRAGWRKENALMLRIKSKANHDDNREHRNQLMRDRWQRVREDEIPKLRAAYWAKRPVLERNCLTCGAEIPNEVRADVVYCNDRCSAKARRDSPAGKVEKTIRSQLERIVDAGYRKERSAVNHLGISFEEACKYIESLWSDGMSWDNHGKNHGFWNIDHIMPVKGEGVDLLNESHVFAICNYRNLQPLWYEENILKTNKVTPEARDLFESLVVEFRG